MICLFIKLICLIVLMKIIVSKIFKVNVCCLFLKKKFIAQKINFSALILC